MTGRDLHELLQIVEWSGGRQQQAVYCRGKDEANFRFGVEMKI